MPPLPEFKLEAYFSRWEFRARYNLAASDAETVSLEELLSLATPEARDRWATLRLGYTQTFGDPGLREAIAEMYDGTGPEGILCFSGGEEGLYCAMHALLGPGDHAVVLVPNYQSTEEVPLSLCATTGVALRPERGWRLDLDEVRDAVTERTKLLAINFPHNPTGASIDRDQLAQLVGLARERGLYLFSDEAYRGLERRPEDRLPQVADLYERGLSLGVVSKAFGLPGLRIGWIACQDRELLGRMERLKHYLSICNSAPSEILALVAVQARDRLWARNALLVDRNLRLAEPFFARWGSLFETYVPDGGCVAFPRWLGAEGVEAFCATLVQEKGVLLLPASVFQSRLGPVPTDRFRIGFGREDFPAAIGELDAFLEER